MLTLQGLRTREKQNSYFEGQSCPKNIGYLLCFAENLVLKFKFNVAIWLFSAR